MAKAMPNFEERPAQFEMMDTIWQALNAQTECVIEASTGIGKTVGYLLPAILYAQAVNKKNCHKHIYVTPTGAACRGGATKD